MTEDTPLIEKENKSAWSQFEDSISKLRDIPKDLWLVYSSVFCQQFLLSGLFLILPLFLSDEYGYSDTQAGALFGIIGVAFAVQSVMLGTIVDKIGVQYSLMAAGFISIFAGVMLVVVIDEYIMALTLVVFVPLGPAMAVPAGKIAPRRYTKEETRPAAYSLYFCTLQLAQVISYGLDDAVLHGSEDGFLGITTYRQCILMGTVTCVIGTLITFFITEKDYEATEDNKVEALGAKYTFQEILRSLLAMKNFYRYIALVFTTFGCRFAYRMMDSTLPKYMTRTIGSTSMYGVVVLTNPLANLFFAPLLTSLVYLFSNYTLMIIGSIIVTLSCFIPIIQSSYAIFVIFWIVLGFGESIFSPRLWEYTIQICPKGKEGTYMAIASLPIALGGFFAGVLSGILLEGFCPEGGSDLCPVLWFTTGLISATTILLMIVLRFCVEEPAYDPEPFWPCSSEAKEPKLLSK